MTGTGKREPIMWKYLESAKDAKTAKAHFNVVEEANPAVELVNGWWAVWCGSPLAKRGEYPELSYAPKNADAGFAHV